MKIKSIAVDFDHTIFERDQYQALSPIQGVQKVLAKFHKAGIQIVVYTCRISIAKKAGRLQKELEFITSCLNEFDIPFTRIETESKPMVDAYIDDKAIRFTGSWSNIEDQIQEVNRG